MPDRMMDQQMDPTTMDLGAEMDQETVVIIAARPDGTFVVESSGQGEQEAMSLDEALNMARTALGGDTDPMAMREEVAGEVYPDDEGPMMGR